VLVLNTGISCVAALVCDSVFLQHFNTDTVNNNVPNEILVLKKQVVVGGFIKLLNEGVVICVLKGR
jgi:hypothetical protein